MSMESDKVDSIKFISAVLIFIDVYLVTKNNTFDHRGLQNNQKRWTSFFEINQPVKKRLFQ